MGLYPQQGTNYKTPAWLSIFLCPPDASADNTKVLGMERRGIVQIQYSRLIHEKDSVVWGYRLAKGWKHPEFISGRQLGKTVRVFHGATLAPDGFVLSVTYSDNPRDRSRTDAMEVVNRALEPFRNARLAGFPPRPRHDPRLSNTP